MSDGRQVGSVENRKKRKLMQMQEAVRSKADGMRKEESWATRTHRHSQTQLQLEIFQADCADKIAPC